MAQTYKEADIQKAILGYLRYKGYVVWKNRAVGIFKQSTGRYIPIPKEERGVSDLIGLTHNGIMFAIEVKMPKKKLTSWQQEFLDKVHASNGIAIVAHSIDDVAEIL